MENNNFYEVGKFYEDDVAKLWEFIHARHMHEPYYDETNMDTSMAEASSHFTDLMIEKIPIRENENFIDIGCGLGLPGIALAKKKRCNVYGITASPYQKMEAEKLAQEEHVDHLTRFFVYDAKHTPFANQQFDAGWFFESIFHIGHEAALMEARRILKEDAVLLITDYIARPSLTEADRNNLVNAFYVQSFKTMEEYPACLEHNGFELLEMQDITDHTLKMKKNKYIEVFNTCKSDIVQIGGSIDFYEKARNFWNYANDLFGNHIGYVMVLCRKKHLA
jgi:cyclopropane fatty-acyl-phospholipid synthase-like methyltransferase